MKEFKSPSLERQLLNLGGRRVALPADTRWCSYRDSYRCYLANLIPMRTIISMGKYEIKQEAINLVLDEMFEQELLELLIIFDCICELTNKCQRSDFNIADALEEELNLQFPICHDFYESLLKARLKKVVKPITLAANILHPVYKGKIFEENESYCEMARSFFEESLNEAGLEDLDAYQKNRGIFQTLQQKKVKCPQTFWILAKGQHPALSDLAQLLLNIPSSTAVIERLFSQWSFVHSKLRNRLTNENSKMLIHIYYTLKMSDSNVHED